MSFKESRYLNDISLFYWKHELQPPNHSNLFKPQYLLKWVETKIQIQIQIQMQRYAQ